MLRKIRISNTDFDPKKIPRLQVFCKIYDKLQKNTSGNIIFSDKRLCLMTLACIVIEKRNLPMPATIANIFTKKTRTQSLWSSAISCYIELY